MKKKGKKKDYKVKPALRNKISLVGFPLFKNKQAEVFSLVSDPFLFSFILHRRSYPLVISIIVLLGTNLFVHCEDVSLPRRLLIGLMKG